jgi:hypothetical protein
LKYHKGQTVILLSIEGKPAAGKATVTEVNEADQTYTVAHYLNDSAAPTLIPNIPAGRLITRRDH